MRGFIVAVFVVCVSAVSAQRQPTGSSGQTSPMVGAASTSAGGLQLTPQLLNQLIKQVIVEMSSSGFPAAPTAGSRIVPQAVSPPADVGMFGAGRMGLNNPFGLMVASQMGDLYRDNAMCQFAFGRRRQGRRLCNMQLMTQMMN